MMHAESLVYNMALATLLAKEAFMADAGSAPQGAGPGQPATPAAPMASATPPPPQPSMGGGSSGGMSIPADVLHGSPHGAKITIDTKQPMAGGAGGGQGAQPGGPVPFRPPAPVPGGPPPVGPAMGGPGPMAGGPAKPPMAGWPR